MRANLDDALLAESVAGAIGGRGAGERRARGARPPGVRWSRRARAPRRGRGEARLDPARYLGAAGALVDRALSAHAGAMTPRSTTNRRPRRRAGARALHSLGSTTAIWEPLLPPSPAPPRRALRPARPRGLARPARPVRARRPRRRRRRPARPARRRARALCGLSLGGMVGMWLAVNAPERIDRLVLCCTSALLGPPEMWSDRAATVRAEGDEAVADAVVSAGSRPAWRGPPPARAVRPCSPRRRPRATRRAAR